MSCAARSLRWMRSSRDITYISAFSVLVELVACCLSASGCLASSQVHCTHRPAPRVALGLICTYTKILMTQISWPVRFSRDFRRPGLREPTRQGVERGVPAWLLAACAADHNARKHRKTSLLCTIHTLPGY